MSGRTSTPPMLPGLMNQAFPLSVAHMRRRLRTAPPGAGLVALTENGKIRFSYAESADRIDRLGHVLRMRGIGEGDRVATLAWNTHQHFELYIAVPSYGAVLHTLNMRLSPEQLLYTITHAEDALLFVDTSLIGSIEPLLPAVPHRPALVVMGHDELTQAARLREAGWDAIAYETLLSAAPPTPYAFPEPTEDQAASLCYTSGTTGDPKGVLYSHRSIALHSTAQLTMDVLAIGRDDTILVTVPMFHVNAWCLPFSAALSGASLILPNRFIRPDRLANLIETERPTLMGAVATVFSDLLHFADENDVDLSSLVKCTSGGAAVPLELMQQLEERHGVTVYQAWGMTETSPTCTIARPTVPRALSDEYWVQRASAGRVAIWVEARVSQDDAAVEGGEIEVRGPWVATAYYKERANDRFNDGWLRTGDLGFIDASGFVHITDRKKDVIKSGGEWISSMELERHIAAHPAVSEVAVIARPDERWTERPLACVVLKAGAHATPDALREFLVGRVPRWWIPESIAFVGALPRNGANKFDKKALRTQRDAGVLHY